MSVVLILAGALVGSMFGYRNSDFTATVGSVVDVGDGTGLTLMARSFSDSYYENGAPSDYASDIVLYRDGQQVAQQTVRVNQPLSFDGTTFYQSFFGPAAVMQVSHQDGSSSTRAACRCSGRRTTRRAASAAWRSTTRA